MEHPTFIEWIVWTALGAVGGAVHVTRKLLTVETLPETRTIVWLMLANMFISAFSGFIGAIAAQQFTTNDSAHVVVAAICGYLGVEAINIITRYFRSRVSQ